MSRYTKGEASCRQDTDGPSIITRDKTEDLETDTGEQVHVEGEERQPPLIASLRQQGSKAISRACGWEGGVGRLKKEKVCDGHFGWESEWTLGRCSTVAGYCQRPT